MRPSLAAAAIAGLSLSAPATAEQFTFVALGDVPYGVPNEVFPPFETLIQTINDTDPVLVVHVGDTKSGSTPCDDQMLDAQLDYMNDFEAPVLYTPGDNEWTDCHRESAGGFDPLERLDYIRTNYFAEAGKTLGAAPIDVESQADSGYPENQRMMQGDIMFVTAHIVGSNNNFEPRDMTAIEEFVARDHAAVDWMSQGFDAASDAAAMVLAIHGDMFETGFDAGDADWPRHSGFKAFGTALKEQAAAFGKPVLLIYGDSHVFTQMRPFPAEAPNLLSLEVPGSQDMHAVQITVDTEAAGVFSAALLRNPALSN